MKRATKNPIVRYLLLGLLAAVIGVNVFALNASQLAGNEVPMPFGFGASVVLSGSMEPALSVGDLLLLREETHYAPGDIVVYQSGNMPVVHRIVDIFDNTVITRGDANNANDAPLAMEAIRGKVIGIIPLLGYLVWALKSPVGILLTLAAAVLLVEGSFRSGKAEKEAEKEKLKAEIRALMEELKEN